MQVTRPQLLVQPLTLAEIEVYLNRFGAIYKIADENGQITAQLWQLLKEFPTGGKQIHDANIVATMLVYGLDTLLTQNVTDMKRFSGKITILPLEQGIP